MCPEVHVENLALDSLQKNNFHKHISNKDFIFKMTVTKNIQLWKNFTPSTTKMMILLFWLRVKGQYNIIILGIDYKYMLIFFQLNFDRKTKLKKLNFFFEYSKLDYGLEIWGGTYFSTLKPIINLRKNCIRVISIKIKTGYTAPL